jgi:glycosyltransferase involved in cell wall biosynthesis
LPLDLSLVIPAHNEAHRIESGYRRVRPVLDDLGPDSLEVVIVDDGSTDRTGEIAATIYGDLPHVRVVRHETNRGKGDAVRLGLAIAAGRLAVVCDADMAISPRHLPEMIATLELCPVAFGARATDGPIRYRSRMRTVAGSAFNVAVRRVSHSSLRDTQCGFKGFQLGAGRLLAHLGLVAGFAYDVEIIQLAREAGLPIATVPVTWDDVAGSSVRVVHDSWRMLRDIWSASHTTHECLVVRAPADTDLDAARVAARAARVVGAVAAIGADTLVVLPRDAALAGVTIAAAIGGEVGSAASATFARRRLVAL